ncbi:hypothetical protein FXB39_00605 [Nocardioides sp. BGMRC 2183]|nr:hypothetical protein FXB39_00605 [Nocardioides sp. BGMRC 2183]
MTTIAVTDTRPTITCPSWCTVPYEDHLADLPAWEGFVIHRSDYERRVGHSCMAYIDGTLDPTNPPLVHLVVPHELSLDDAEALAGELLAAVREARR